MLETVNVTRTIGAGADAAWAAIAAIEGLDRWFSVIDTCRVEGQGEGATRYLGLSGGGEIEDRIVSIDHARRRFEYNRTRSPFPVSSYIGVVSVRPISEQTSEVSWVVEIEVAPDAKDELAAFLRTALSGGVEGLERELKG
jgi:uncharacterized protein YndB with AHSA1/START domain